MHPSQRLLAGLILLSLLLSGTVVMAADFKADSPADAPLVPAFNLLFGRNPFDGWYGGFRYTIPPLEERGIDLTIGGRYGFTSQEVTGAMTLGTTIGEDTRVNLNCWNFVTYRGIYGSFPLWTENLSYQLSAQRPLSDTLTLRSVLTRTEITGVSYEGTLPVDGGITANWRTTLSARPSLETAAYVAWDHGMNVFNGQYRYDRLETGGMHSLAIDNDRSLTLYGKAAALTGTYPAQSALALGDQRFLLDQHFADSFWGLTGNLDLNIPMVNPVNPPYLRGYEPNAFRGDRLYSVSVEYARTLFSDVIEGPFRFEYVCFLDAGNAWFQGNNPGPLKASAGAGLRFHLPLPINQGDYLNNTGISVSMDLARGFSAGAEWKLGLSAGLSYAY